MKSQPAVRNGGPPPCPAWLWYSSTHHWPAPLLPTPPPLASHLRLCHSGWPCENYATVCTGRDYPPLYSPPPPTPPPLPPGQDTYLAGTAAIVGSLPPRGGVRGAAAAVGDRRYAVIARGSALLIPPPPQTAPQQQPHPTPHQLNPPVSGTLHF